MTHGAAHAIQAALGLSDDDVQTSVTSKPSTATRYVGTRSSNSNSLVKTTHRSYDSASSRITPNDSHLELQQAMTASLEDLSAYAYGLFQAADDGSTAVHVCVFGRGPMARHIVNATFAERFQDAQALVEKAIHYQLAPCILLAPYVPFGPRECRCFHHTFFSFFLKTPNPRLMGPLYQDGGARGAAAVDGRRDGILARQTGVQQVGSSEGETTILCAAGGMTV